MNRTNLTDILTRAVEETIEEMAFTLLCQNPNASIAKEFDGLLRRVQLSVIYPIELSLILSLTPNLLLDITVNIYGLEQDEITPEMEKDTIGEILNTITGRVMKDLIPSDQIYELGIPVMVKEGELAELVESCINCVFESDEGEYLTVSLLTCD